VPTLVCLTNDASLPSVYSNPCHTSYVAQSSTCSCKGTVVRFAYVIDTGQGVKLQ